MVISLLGTCTGIILITLFSHICSHVGGWGKILTERGGQEWTREGARGMLENADERRWTVMRVGVTDRRVD